MRGKVKIERGPAEVTPELVLQAYAEGLFPMAEGREDPRLFWIDPDWRAILPMESFHVPRRLASTMRRGVFEVRIDTAFEAVVEGCAGRRAQQTDTWISHKIETLYLALHRLDHAHSVECWQEGALVGGLYGVALGGAFFGESMFGRVRDASKVALASTHEHLKAQGFALFDVQFWTPHLAQFGAAEIPRGDYLTRLRSALELEVTF